MPRLISSIPQASTLPFDFDSVSFPNYIVLPISQALYSIFGFRLLVQSIHSNIFVCTDLIPTKFPYKLAKMARDCKFKIEPADTMIVDYPTPVSSIRSGSMLKKEFEEIDLTMSEDEASTSVSFQSHDGLLARDYQIRNSRSPRSSMSITLLRDCGLFYTNDACFSSPVLSSIDPSPRGCNNYAKPTSRS